MQILVPVTDVDRAADFYEHVLGLPLLFRYPGNAFFDADGVRLYLAAADRAGLRRPRDDLLPGRRRDRRRSSGWRRAARRSASRPEIAHRDADYDLWLAFVQDPDGNNIGLMREAPKGLERG